MGGGDVVRRAATNAPPPGDQELNWIREVYGFSHPPIQLSILPYLLVEFITYLISCHLESIGQKTGVFRRISLDILD